MKLKKGDKVYFTKESAPNFNEKVNKMVTPNKEYRITYVDGELCGIIGDSGLEKHILINGCAHLSFGTWLKVKTKKRKLEKEIEELQRKLETTEQLLKVSRERIDEYKVEKLRLVYEILQTLGDVTFDVK